MTIKSQIIQYIRSREYAGEKFVYGGSIEEYIRATDGAKGDTTARRLRELVEEGWLKKNPDSRFNQYALGEKI